MVSANRLPPSKVYHSAMVVVLCMHADMLHYPMIDVDLQLGTLVLAKRCLVAVAPNLLVDVLLATDVL